MLSLRSQSRPNTGDIARMSALEGQIAASTSELEDLQEKSSKIEKAIQDLEKKILDIGGSKLLTQKSKVDGIRLHINLANDEITKAEVAKAKAEKDSTKLDTSIIANKAAVADANTEVEQLEGQLEELMAYVSELTERVEEAQAAAENSKEDLDKRKAALTEKEDAIRAYKERTVRVISLNSVSGILVNILLFRPSSKVS